MASSFAMELGAERHFGRQHVSIWRVLLQWNSVLKSTLEHGIDARLRNHPRLTWHWAQWQCNGASGTGSE